MEAQIPNKIVTINDKDAPWVTSSVKNILHKNKNIYADWVKKGRNPQTMDRIQRSQLEINCKVNEAKCIYISNLSKQLCDPATGHKSFWSAYKQLSNKKNITNIPPLFEEGKYYRSSRKNQIFLTHISQLNVGPSKMTVLCPLSFPK